MRLIRIMEKGGDDYREYKKAVKPAKKAIETICELTEDMEEQYGERGSVRYRKDRDYDEYEVEERGGRSYR